MRPEIPELVAQVWSSMRVGFSSVGNAGSLRGRIAIGLPTRVQLPTRRVTNPPQVENLLRISVRDSIDTGVRLWKIK
jgi:hypothetical protein